MSNTIKILGLLDQHKAVQANGTTWTPEKPFVITQIGQVFSVLADASQALEVGDWMQIDDKVYRVYEIKERRLARGSFPEPKPHCLKVIGV